MEAIAVEEPIALGDARLLGKGATGETYLVNVMGPNGVLQFVLKKALGSVPKKKQEELRQLLEREKDFLVAGESCGDIVPRALRKMVTDSDGDIGFLQEYLPGATDLAKAIADGKKGFGSVYLSIFVEDMLETLKCLHSKGIIHNDIKPDNVLVKVGDGRVEPRVYRLIDFGASCFVEGDLKKKRTCGCDRLSDPSTTLFLAPESYLALWQLFVSDVQMGRAQAEWIQSLAQWSSTPRDKCTSKQMLEASDHWALAMTVLYVCVMASGDDAAMAFWDMYEDHAAKTIGDGKNYVPSIKKMYEAYNFFFEQLPTVLKFVERRYSLALATYLRDALHADPEKRKNRLTEGVTASKGKKRRKNASRLSRRPSSSRNRKVKQ